MPSSKSLTSIEPEYRSLIEQRAAEGDHLFLLLELLSIIHRDGGQYTKLAGLGVSVTDAITQVLTTRRLLRECQHRRPRDE